jgi:hypothetical protein
MIFLSCAAVGSSDFTLLAYQGMILPMTSQEAGAISSMMSFTAYICCTHTNYSLRNMPHVQLDEYMQNLCVKGKRQSQRPRNNRDDNMKMELAGVGVMYGRDSADQ